MRMKKPLLNAQEQEAFLAFRQQSHPADHFPKPSTALPNVPTMPEAPLQGKIVDSKLLTGPLAEKPVYLVTVEASADLSFEAGDAFGIYAPNDQEPDPLLLYADLSSFPKKSLLMSLAAYCRTEESRQLLHFLASKSAAGSAAYNRLREEEFLSAKVLRAFLGDELQVPAEELVKLVGLIQPRYYSACRAQPLMPNSRTFQFCFNVSRRFNANGQCIWEGLASSWLERCIVRKNQEEEATPPTFPLIQRSVKNFRLPRPLPPSKPIVMIGAGTGVAPFVGFLDELGMAGAAVPFTWLIFGFRARESDFLFEEELTAASTTHNLSKLSLAQSRGSDGVAKEYVQDVIKREADLFFRLLVQEEASVFVCGDELGMIRGVNEAIAEILMAKGVVGSEKEAQQLLLQLTSQGRIIRDIWV